MSSSDAMFEASPVDFLSVNERAAHVKIDVFPVGVDLGRNKSLISLVVGCFRLLGFYELESKDFESIRKIV